jgi:hypothetical protein
MNEFSPMLKDAEEIKQFGLKPLHRLTGNSFITLRF